MFKHSGMTLKIRRSTSDGNIDRLSSDSACYFSVQKLFPSPLLLTS